MLSLIHSSSRNKFLFFMLICIDIDGIISFSHLSQTASTPSFLKHVKYSKHKNTFLTNDPNSQTNNYNNSFESTFPSIANKNLVSIQDCLEAMNIWKTNKENSSSPIFIDASWYHKGNRNGRTEFVQGPRIVNAKYLDMDDIATTKDLFPNLNPKNLPHMLPTKELFAATMDALEIQNNDHIILYGKSNSIFIPRTWFLFKSMGHDLDKIHIMQGSLEEWIEQGGDIDTNPLPNHFTTKTNEILSSTSIVWASDLNLTKPTKYKTKTPINVCDMSFVQEAIDSNQDSKEIDTLILDPRGSSFQSKGYIPNSIHIPYKNLVQANNTLVLKPKEELHQIFENAGVDINTKKSIICSCGSGVSVCHLMLALEECGRIIDYDNEQTNDNGRTYMYDGSWAEWGSDPNTPKVKNT